MFVGWECVKATKLVGYANKRGWVELRCIKFYAYPLANVREICYLWHVVNTRIYVHAAEQEIFI